MLTIMEVYMSHRINFPPRSGPPPATPIVYVRDKLVWEYKLLSRNLAKEEAPSEEELNALGKEGWELAASLMQGGIACFYFKRLKD